MPAPFRSGTLAREAAADRLRGAVDRRLLLGHRSNVRGPERRLFVADQLGSDRLHASGRQQQSVDHVGHEYAADRGLGRHRIKFAASQIAIR